MRLIAHGKINTLLKTLRVLLETFLPHIFPSKGLKLSSINLIMNILFLDPPANIKEKEEMVVIVAQLWRRRKTITNRFPKVELLRREKLQCHNLEGIMIEQTYQFELITKALLQSWSGKLLSIT